MQRPTVLPLSLSLDNRVKIFIVSFNLALFMARSLIFCGGNWRVLCNILKSLSRRKIFFVCTILGYSISSLHKKYDKGKKLSKKPFNDKVRELQFWVMSSWAQDEAVSTSDGYALNESFVRSVPLNFAGGRKCNVEISLILMTFLTEGRA